MKHHSKSDSNTQRIVLCGILVSIAVVLDGFLKVPLNLFGAYSIKLSFGMIPILFIAVRFGPLYGGMCGATMDFLQAMLFPLGGFNPLFIISAFVCGAIPGLFFRHGVGANPSKPRLLLAIFCGQFTGSVLLSTFFLILSYGLPWELIWARAVTQAVLVPLYVGALTLVFHVEQMVPKTSARSA